MRRSFLKRRRRDEGVLRRATLQRIVCAVLLLSGSISCSRGEGVAARCKRVRDHLVELELPVAAGDRELKASLMVRALGDEFLASCARSMTEDQRGCVLEASDSRSALACSARSRQ